MPRLKRQAAASYFKRVHYHYQTRKRYIDQRTIIKTSSSNQIQAGAACVIIILMATNTNTVNGLQRSLADSIILMAPLDDIRILLACGAKVNEPVTQGLRALHYAVWQKHISAVRLLLIRGANINSVDDCGYSALHLAAEHGYLEMAQVLLDSGAKVDYREPTEELFPKTTLCDEPLRLALKNKHYDLAKLLLEHGANPNTKYFFGSEINMANDIQTLSLLLKFGAKTETKDRAGLTPLMKAARDREGFEQVELFLNYMADVNAMTDSRNDFRTVLHFAILSGNISIVNILIKNGADVDQKPPFPEPDRPSPLDLAILSGDPYMVEILLRAGANVNRCSPIIGSPLHVSCAENVPNRLEIMKLLLLNGADPTCRVPCGTERNAILRPPLVELLGSNATVSLSEIRLLLRYGARVIIRTQYKDPDGILNYLNGVTMDLFEFLINCAEEFDLCMIRRNIYLSEQKKQLLMKKATNPLPLKALCRAKFRKTLGRNLCDCISQFFLPKMLTKYLDYDFY